MFGFKHTMNNLGHDRIDHKAVRNRLNNRVLEVRGRDHLQELYPYVVARFKTTFHWQYAHSGALKGQTPYVLENSKSVTNVFQMGAEY